MNTRLIVAYSTAALTSLWIKQTAPWPLESQVRKCTTRSYSHRLSKRFKLLKTL